MTVRRVLPVGDVSRARTKPPVPPSAAWEVGDPVAERRFAQIGDLRLEGYCQSSLVSPFDNPRLAAEVSGSRAQIPGRLLANGALPHVTMAYETWGTLNAAQDNAVLILHALTGDAHVTGSKTPGQLTAGWWSEMVGPGCPIDTNKYYVVAPNVLGGCSGSTGPASRSPRGTRWGGNFPRLTVRDQVNAEIALAKQLGITRWRLVLGASMGGLRALEWSLLGPENGIAVDGLCAIATTAATSSDQIAWAHPQLAAIRLDPGYHGGNYYDLYDDAGPHRGLAVARQIAHATYRSAAELDQRFARFPQSGEDPFVNGRYAIQSYLDHHGDKLARRFDANTYVVLTEAMFTHDLGRDRGGTDAALASIAAKTLVVAVDSDRLYPVSQSERIAAQVPSSELAIINSVHGHDGFLIEFSQLEPVIRNFLTQLEPGHQDAVTDHHRASCLVVRGGRYDGAMLAAYVDRLVPEAPLDGLVVGEQLAPEPRELWTTVKVKAAALNHHDLWALKGVGLSEQQLPMILGTDAAGIAPDGSEVIVHGVIGGDGVGVDSRENRSLLSEKYPGTLAEYVSVPTANLIPKPAELSFAQAACLPTAYLTAYNMLFRAAKLKPGHSVLVQGAGGGVATAAIILGKAAGLEVYATSRSTGKREQALKLGAVWAGAPGDRLPKRVDAVVESVGAATWGHSIRSVRPGGTIAVCGATSGDAPSAELTRVFFNEIKVVGVTMGTRVGLAALAQFLVATGTRPLIDSEFSLPEVKQGLSRMAQGYQTGKIVINIS